MIECLNCGEEYPSTACRWRCPSCGFKDTCCEGEPRGRTFREPARAARFDDWSE